MRNHKNKAVRYSQVNVYLYTFLLIITPFLMLQNYLQSFVGQLSAATFLWGGIDIPYVIVVALLISLVLIISYRKKLTKYNIFILFLGLILLIIGQKSSDYYFNHKFYELQHNWHYIAYILFALIKYRNLKYRNFPTSKIMINIFISAALISTFDEIIQVFISSRIFDICDIAKDVWGAFIGIFFILFMLEKKGIKFKEIRLRERKLGNYLKNHFTLIFQLFLISYIWLSVSSLLTDEIFVFPAVVISLMIYLLVFIIFHLTQFQRARVFFLILLLIIISVQSFFLIKYSSRDIIYNSPGITCYKGIPIIYFDIMIHPNGCFRLVDKKRSFIYRDLLKLKSLNPDIILIGTGSQDQGGYGFPAGKHPQFIHDSLQDRYLQVIIEPNSKAVTTFNRLKNENKLVLFVIHNT